MFAKQCYISELIYLFLFIKLASKDFPPESLFLTSGVLLILALPLGCATLAKTFALPGT